MSAPADRIVLRDLHSPPMRAFHVTWATFFLCFFAWFSTAPLMAVIREDLGLNQTQIGNIIIASVAFTVVARVGVGWLCDRLGPRRAYVMLLGLGSVPVAGIAFVQSYEAFLVMRLAIGGLGASFVITQFHTTQMFAPACVGTANATTAGWGNLGGGVVQIAMPLLLAMLVSFGLEPALGWRVAMFVPAVGLLVMAGVYWFGTQDTPHGDWHARPKPAERARHSARAALTDGRVWILFVLYGACFGVELTIHNVAALYFVDTFGMGLMAAGVAAGCFGLMNLFARSLGGLVSDRLAARTGLIGRVRFLVLALLAEGLLLTAFSRLDVLAPAMVLLILFSLFVQMAEGATFAVVPFVRRESIGIVVGVVAAGGNVGAVLAGFLFRSEGLAWADALGILGLTVAAASLLGLGIRFHGDEDLSAPLADPQD